MIRRISDVPRQKRPFLRWFARNGEQHIVFIKSIDVPHVALRIDFGKPDYEIHGLGLVRRQRQWDWIKVSQGWLYGGTTPRLAQLAGKTPHSHFCCAMFLDQNIVHTICLQPHCKIPLLRNLNHVQDHIIKLFHNESLYTDILKQINTILRPQG